MSSMPDGGRRREAQALPLSGLARSNAGYSGILQEVGAKGENVGERMEMRKRYSRAPSVKANGIEVTSACKSGSPRHFGGSGACKRAPGLSPKATRRLMS